jgi:hypothetical protein
MQARSLLFSGEAGRWLIPSLLEAAKSAYVHGQISVEELERRVERALSGERTPTNHTQLYRKVEWLDG